MSGLITLLDFAGYVALLLWGVHMVQTGVQRAFGAALGAALGRALGTRLRAFAAGLGMGSWYLYFKFIGEGAGHVQSAILATACTIIGFLLVMMGFMADLIGVNRRLLERIDWRVKRLEQRAASRERTP